MKNKECCFFCTTPFQIISAVSIVLDKSTTADLYIVNKFKDAEIYAERIRNEHIYKEVTVIDESLYKPNTKNRISIWFSVFLSYFRVNKIALNILNSDTRYKEMYISSKAFVGRIVGFYLIKNHINTEIVYFDDGVGSYFNKKILEPGLTDRLLRKILFGKKGIGLSKKLVLYSPKLFQLVQEKKYEIDLLPNVHGKNDQINKMNRIFDFKIDNVILESIILIDCLKKKNFNSTEEKKLLKIYDTIFEKCGKKNIIIKRHPRDNEKKIEDKKYYVEESLPFESVCMNMNLNNKLLISVSSTAVVTPKLLFNQEPKIILLYRLVEQKGLNRYQIDFFFENCKKLYTTASRFMIPETMEELTDLLQGETIL